MVIFFNLAAMEASVEAYTPNFSLQVEGVKGFCPAGEVYAKQQIEKRTIPVLSCEGPCIRGEIARLAANYIAQDTPSLARACHAETFVVPHSAMARWVKGAERSIMIDGCFLKCHGRVLTGLVGADRMIQIDALPFYRKYTDIFLMDDVPEDERKAVARQVADKIIAKLKEDGALMAAAA
ncbi:MAG TPA: putative zinc-binding protein [Burkholderiales bacterium]|nr:putative zinc-binding protein [Burkholderiales bacterium]